MLLSAYPVHIQYLHTVILCALDLDCVVSPFGVQCSFVFTVFTLQLNPGPTCQVSNEVLAASDSAWRTLTFAAASGVYNSRNLWVQPQVCWALRGNKLLS